MYGENSLMEGLLLAFYGWFDEGFQIEASLVVHAIWLKDLHQLDFL